jgi:predicted transcriptional regulator
MASGQPTEGTNSQLPRSGDTARKDVPVCHLEERLGEVRDRASAAGWDAAVVVDRDRVVLGLLRSKELARDPNLTIEEAMRPGPSTYRPFVLIKEMAHTMLHHALDSSPITTSDGKLVGLLMRADVERLGEGPAS